MIQRKLKTCASCGEQVYYWSRRMCKPCWQRNNVKPIKKKITTSKIVENNNYYRKAIASNIIKNGGRCLCDECGDRILSPSGSNVSHIIGKGANPSLYHDDRNHFILCFTCEQAFSNEGKRKEMKIYSCFERIRTELNHEYYTK